jgi:hypothetical protein
VPTFRRLAIVGAGDGEKAAAKVDVVLPEAKEFSLAEARVEGDGEERGPAGGERPEQGHDFLGPKVVVRAARNVADLDRRGGVWPGPAPRPLGPIEGREDEATEVVERLGAQAPALALKELLEPARGDLGETQLGEFGAEEVLADGVQRARVRRLPDRIRREPPPEKLAEGAAAVLRELGLKPEALPLGGALDVGCQALGGRLGGRRRRPTHPAPRGIAVLHVPAAFAQDDGRQGLTPPSSGTEVWQGPDAV